jgi:hypothetical protein
MLKSLKFMVVLGLVSVNGVGMAQTATQPATTSAPARHVMVVPSGFNKITISGHTVMAEPADEAWVRKTLETLTPSTKPTTMPSDVRDKLASMKDQLAARMSKDLALTDSAAIEKLLGDKLPAALKIMSDVQLPVFYLCTTESRLAEVVRNGWSDPRVHYNRITDKVEVVPAAVSVNSDADDVLSTVLYLPGDTPEQRGQALADRVHGTDSRIADYLSAQTIINTDIGIYSFIVDQVFTPLKLQHDQEWFAIGLADALSMRYAADLTGVSEQTFIQFNTSDNTLNPIRPATIDLIHPIDLTTIRPAAMGAYADAYRRKAIRVMVSWTTRAGDDAIPKLLAELRKGMPPDGPTLVQKIQQVSGVDLSGDVVAGK